MSKALIAGINQIATDKGLDREVIFDAIEAALISAYKRNYGSISNVTSEVDRVSGEMRVFTEREVVEDVVNERTEVTLQRAQKINPDIQLGDLIDVQTSPANFGRIAAQTAKQVILQRIREAERDTVFENFSHRVGEVLSGQVRSVDAMSGAVSVLLEDKHECLLTREEQIPNERLRRGDHIQLYVMDVHKSTRGPVIKISRTHKSLLRRLLENEIPEIRDGIVEIKAIAREPGARSKAAVIATVPGVDPVGSCVGMRGLRIQNIVNELAGEKIDVVEWSADLRSYITNALSPAKVKEVYLDDDSSINTAIVVVPNRQLSLAIGKEGQNARLAAKLTGWRIDIKSETEAIEEGLEELYSDQSLVTSAEGEDLLAVAEKLLRGEEGSFFDLDDAIDKVADFLDEQDGEFVSDEDSEIFSLSFDNGFGGGSNDAFSQALSMVESSDAPVLETFAEDEVRKRDTRNSETSAMDAMAVAAAALEAERQAKFEERRKLPDITSDMLQPRRRSNRRDGDDDDFEIPDELLSDLGDSDFELDFGDS
ncbi:MAG: transcription termination factor NusA [Chloroflexota bacterium]